MAGQSHARPYQARSPARAAWITEASTVVAASAACGSPLFKSDREPLIHDAVHAHNLSAERKTPSSVDLHHSESGNDNA